MTAIREFVLGFYDGPHATPKESDEGPIFLGIKNVTAEGRLDLSEIRHVSREEFARWTKRVKPRAGDVVFSYEATLHRYAIIPQGFEGCLGRRMALIRPDPEKLDARFLHFYLLSPAWRNLVDEHVITGATVNRLPLTKVPDFPVQFPGLEGQRRIASILSAYDDLIENNRRRISLLEDSARQLYREWFIRFRFPGHEHVKIIDGVPEGWERVTVGAITTKLGSGATPRGGSASYQDSGIALIRSQNVYDFRFEDDGLVHLTDEQADKLGNVIVQREDILLNITGASVARCCQVPERLLPARVNQHVMIVRADKALCPPNFLLHSINSNQNKEKLLSIGRAGGATREALTKDTVAGFEVLMPPKALLAAFDLAVQPLVDQAYNLSAMNEHLARARDLLLPKLMSGAIAV